MFSPEFTNFLMTYQMNEYKEEKPEKEYIELKQKGSVPAYVCVEVKK